MMDFPYVPDGILAWGALLEAEARDFYDGLDF